MLTSQEENYILTHAYVPEHAIGLIIDEFEGIPDEVLGEVMHTFREIYHEKKLYHLELSLMCQQYRTFYSYCALFPR